MTWPSRTFCTRCRRTLQRPGLPAIGHALRCPRADVAAHSASAARLTSIHTALHRGQHRRRGGLPGRAHRGNRTRPPSGQGPTLTSGTPWTATGGILSASSPGRLPSTTGPAQPDRDPQLRQPGPGSFDVEFDRLPDVWSHRSSPWAYGEPMSLGIGMVTIDCAEPATAARAARA